MEKTFDFLKILVLPIFISVEVWWSHVLWSQIEGLSKYPRLFTVLLIVRYATCLNRRVILNVTTV